MQFSHNILFTHLEYIQNRSHIFLWIIQSLFILFIMLLLLFICNFYQIQGRNIINFSSLCLIIAFLYSIALHHINQYKYYIIEDEFTLHCNQTPFLNMRFLSLLSSMLIFTEGF
jgi:uncharacterized membrane-anchored protein